MGKGASKDIQTGARIGRQRQGQAGAGAAKDKGSKTKQKGQKGRDESMLV